MSQSEGNNTEEKDTNDFPTNLITQVTQKQIDEEQDLTNEEDESELPVSSEEEHEEYKRSFWQKLCCCCCFHTIPPPPETEEEQKDETELDVTELPEESTIESFLLPPQSPEYLGRKCLVLDLDETLVHSSFKPIPNPDFIVPVEIEDVVHKVYVLKRPGVDKFLEEMGKIFEVIVFTASLSKYADPVLDLLDPSRVVQHRLFRESCRPFKGNYVKDLATIGRDKYGSVIIDNSPTSYIFSQEYAIGCETWFDDPTDTELLDMIPFLQRLSKADSVKTFLSQAKKRNGRFVYE